MKRIILIILLTCATSLVVASDVISKDEAVAAAQKILKPELKEKYTRITSTKWKEHVKSWMIVFEHPNENIEDGYWIMIDGKGGFVDMGKVYADH
jgi:hypothetical protein